MNRQANVVFYRGGSAINQKPIIAGISALKGSGNEKTANMLQIPVFSQEAKPHEAANSGIDESVCGDCDLRKAKRQTDKKTKYGCYVVLYRKVMQWLSLMRKDEDLEYAEKALLGKGEFLDDIRPVRVGEYGNPSAIPRTRLEWMFQLIERGYRRGWTAYDSQWRNPENAWLARFAMASVQTLAQKEEANDLGWRTFRQLAKDEKLQDDEIMCPYYSDNLSCQECLLCCGTSKGAKNIVAPNHTAATAHQLKGFSK